MPAAGTSSPIALTFRRTTILSCQSRGWKSNFCRPHAPIRAHPHSNPNPSLMKIRLVGASGGEVTGSCYVVETKRARIQVDCGLFQGGRKSEALNRPPAAPNRKLDAVVLTHAHLDHTGRLPMLAKLTSASPWPPSFNNVTACCVTSAPPGSPPNPRGKPIRIHERKVKGR